MPSRILRRSGCAVTQYCKLIGFVPDVVYLVGVGPHHEEVDVMREEWPDFYLFGFEPHPNTYSAIKDTFPGRLFNVALSDWEGRASLFFNSRHRNGASLFEREEKPTNDIVKVTDVQVTRLDKLNVGAGCDGLLWLDCEGSELQALKGSENLIERHIQMVNVEMTGVPPNHQWSKPVDVHRWLMDKGFIQVWCHTIRHSIGQFDAIYVRENWFRPSYCNVLQALADYEGRV